MQIHNLSKYLSHLPFELNAKNPIFGLQTNDYFQISYFKSKTSFYNNIRDNSFNSVNDSGKKITICLFLFPKELLVS